MKNLAHLSTISLSRPFGRRVAATTRWASAWRVEFGAVEACRRRHAGDRQARGVAPEHLEVVVETGCGLEEVHDGVHEVSTIRSGSGRACWSGTWSSRSAPIFSTPREAHLHIGGAGGDDEEVGQLALAAEVEHEHVGALVRDEFGGGCGRTPSPSRGPGWARASGCPRSGRRRRIRRSWVGSSS